MFSFITDGNFIIFRFTETDVLRSEHDRYRLHNTSKCIDWALPEDTTRITFTIDEGRYENIPLSSIDFDGDVCDVQQDFIDGVQGMFENLAGGGEGAGSLQSATVELTDAQIKALPTTLVDIVPAQGVGKMVVPVTAFIQSNFEAGVYTNIVDASWQLTNNATGDVSDTKLSAPLRAEAILNSQSSQLYFFAIPEMRVGASSFAGYVVTSTSFTEPGNKPLSIGDGFSDSGSPYTGGNAANTLKVTVYYVVVDL